MTRAEFEALSDDERFAYEAKVRAIPPLIEEARSVAAAAGDVVQFAELLVEMADALVDWSNALRWLGEIALATVKEGS